MFVINPIFISKKKPKTYHKVIAPGVAISASGIITIKTYDKFQASKNKKNNHKIVIKDEKHPNNKINDVVNNNQSTNTTGNPTTNSSNDNRIISQLPSSNQVVIPSPTQNPSNNIPSIKTKTQFTMDDIVCMIPSECYLSRVMNTEVINYFINYFNKHPDQARVLLLMASIKSSLKQILSVDLNSRLDEWDTGKINGRFFDILTALNGNKGYDLSSFLARLRSADGKDMADLIESHLSDTNNEIIRKNVEKFAQFLQKDKTN